MKLPISVVVPVLNEEKNLPDCLSSVRFCDQVFVVDSGSKDRTGEAAKRFGAEVAQFNFKPGGPRKKNWSLDNLPFKNEWVLLIDADERITAELEREIRQLFAAGPDADAYYLNRMHFFLGRWLKYGGNFPSWNLRLLKKNAGRYERLGTEELSSAGDVEVHEHIKVDGRAGYLKEPMLHEDFKDLSHFIDRHNRYSSWDARMRERLAAGAGGVDSIEAKFFGQPVERKRFLKKMWLKLPCKPLMRFLYMYVFRLGFLDGRAGFIYSAFKAVQEFHIGAKQYEASLSKPATMSPSPKLLPAGAGS